MHRSRVASGSGMWTCSAMIIACHDPYNKVLDSESLCKTTTDNHLFLYYLLASPKSFW
jgi:hypothetical protein